MAEIKIKADSNGGTVSLKGPATTTGDAAIQLTLPVDDGASGQYLKTDGSGALSWATVASVGGANALELNDGVKANFGTDDDLQIWHDDSNAYISNNKGAFVIQDSHAGANAVIIRKAGEVELLHNNVLACETSANGLAFPSGKGIDFSATSDGSGTDTSELLDDYEEGTFTPTWDSGLSSIGYTHQLGSYTKIGNRVFFSLYLLTASGTTGGSRLNIGGLPYNNDTSNPQAGAYVVLSNNMFDGKHIELYLTSNNINFYEQNNTDLTSSEASPIGKNLVIQGFYRV